MTKQMGKTNEKEIEYKNEALYGGWINDGYREEGEAKEGMDG